MPWWRRRRGFRRRRRFRRPRRGYRRRRMVRRRFRRPRRRFRRRRGARKEVLTQWRPSVVRRCTIFGWAPLLVGTEGAMENVMNLETVTAYIGGGSSKVHLSLGALYKAHLKHWNYWTASNEGTDLCKYLGTKITLYPHDEISYIVSWDREFKSEDTYPNFVGHPMLLWLGRQHTIVLSHKDAGGKSKPKKIFIKPPALLSSEWYFQTNFVNYGLFQLRASVFSPHTHVWTRHSTDFSVKIKTGSSTNTVDYDIFHDTGIGNQVAFGQEKTGWQPNDKSPLVPGTDTYWGDDYPYWLSLFGMNIPVLFVNHSQWKLFIKWFPPTGTAPAQKPDFGKPKRWYNIEKVMGEQIALMGPGIPKEENLANWQSIFKYKSFWLWGGHTPDRTRGEERNPAMPSPTTCVQFGGVQVRDPARVGTEIIHPWDLRRGLLTSTAFKRITEEKTKKNALLFTESKGLHVETRGEPTDSELSLSEEEQDEDSSCSEWEMEQEAPPKKRKLKQRDLDLLRKLRKLL
ncbi:ORF1 [Anelloviridae sp.]|nr:ORF1 [Anelloviridae sp.]